MTSCPICFSRKVIATQPGSPWHHCQSCGWEFSPREIREPQHAPEILRIDPQPETLGD